jgi:hypothetical protein
VADKVEGIFVSTEPGKESNNSNPNTPEQQEIVTMVQGDYQVFKADRQEIEDTWREEERMYEGGKRQWEGLRSSATMKNRPNSTDNIAFSQIEGIVSALTGWTPEGTFEATENGDEQKSKELTKYMPFELRQIKFKQKYVKAVRRFVNHGLLLFKTVYNPDVEGGRGNNRWTGQNDIIPLDYGCFFPDPRIRDLMYIQKSKAMIIHQRKPLEYFKERWEKQGKKVMEDMYSEDVEIFESDRNVTERAFNANAVQGTLGPEKQKTSGLIEYWYKGTPKMVSPDDKKLFMEMAKEKIEEGKDPSSCIAKAEGKAKGIHCIYISTSGVFLEHKAYVYDHGNYPVIVRCLFTIEGTIWPKGYMRDLISPQIMLNKFSELAVEQTAKMGNGAIIYEEGSIAESKIPIWKRLRSSVGAMLPATRKDGIQEIEGKGPPTMIMNFIQHWLTILQKIPRRFDNASGGVSYQGESGKHAEALQAAAHGNLSTPTELIEDALVEVLEQYIELIAQFYTQERIGRVLNQQVTIGRSYLLNQAQSSYMVPQEDGTEIEMEVTEEYVPAFDITVTIGVERPMDRQYWIQTAQMLFQTIDPLTGLPVIDAKALQYSVENGRMEPFDVIDERIKKDVMLQQKMQELQQQNEQLNAQVQQMGSELQKVDSSKTESETRRQEFEQNKSVNQQELEWAKLDQQGKQTELNAALQMEKLRQPVGVR